ncbi:MAG: hypothetical protein AB7G75_14100 [Candidatus Binatia bacterium]
MLMYREDAKTAQNIATPRAPVVRPFALLPPTPIQRDQSGPGYGSCFSLSDKGQYLRSCRPQERKHDAQGPNTQKNCSGYSEEPALLADPGQYLLRTAPIDNQVLPLATLSRG